MNANKNNSPSEKLDYVIKELEFIANRQRFSFAVTIVAIISVMICVIGISLVFAIELAK